MIKNSFKMLIIDLVSFIVLLVLDQYSKIAMTSLKGQNEIELIKGVLEFRYLENQGAAFGILQGQRYLFLVLTIIVFIGIAFLLLKMPSDKKYLYLNVVLTFILAGAIGNCIDRLYLGYVRDFIYFSLIDFPIFNVADIYITCATPVLILLIMFYYKEDDLNFIKNK